MLDYERPYWPLMGAHSARRHLEKIMLLPDMFRTYSIAQLLDFADSLDPNNGFRESVDDDDSITRDSLADAMLAAYDDIDTYTWINE